MSEPVTAKVTTVKAERASLGRIFEVFLMAGAISFGGGVVAYLREYLVHGEGWLNDDDFLDALEVSQTLPGLNSVNLSVVVGDRLRGILGAAVAVAGILLPGMLIVMTLGVLWEEQRQNVMVKSFLIGVAVAAVGLLATVTVQLGHRQLTHWLDLSLVMCTFIAVSVFHVSLLVVLITIGPFAVWIYRPGSHHGEREVKLPHPHFHRRHELLRN
ncbi:MAG TPA: chromate transporter [Candidatus Binataceae bacterium]|nr:chromate transporter [Candidatus Binataceae bacterium]